MTLRVRLRAALDWLAAPAFMLQAVIAAQEIHHFGAATFVAPPGWSLESRPGTQMVSRVQGADRCMLVLSDKVPAPSEPAAAHATSSGKASAFTRALELNPASSDAKQKLEALKTVPE